MRLAPRVPAAPGMETKGTNASSNRSSAASTARSKSIPRPGYCISYRAAASTASSAAASRTLILGIRLELAGRAFAAAVRPDLLVLPCRHLFARVFAAWIAANPESGDVIPGSGGCRKARWSRAGSGKRGGVRVIHYNQLADGRIYLLLIYAKSAKDNVPANVLLKIKETLNAHD